MGVTCIAAAPEGAQLWMQQERGRRLRSFELSTRVQAISRGDGRSATAAAAYRACCAIDCEHEGRTHDYRRKGGLEASEIVLPAGAPAWAKDRAKLWNAAEMRERNKDKRAKSAMKANAQTARDVLFSFPAELSPQGRLNAARIVARHLADTHGVAADFNLHQPGREGDERNHHCHLMFTTRRLTAKGLGEKTREWDERDSKAPSLAKQLRGFIAATLNAELKAEGKSDLVHVEHKSFADRGSSQKPTIHQGPAKTNVQRKQQGQARAAWMAEQKAAQLERHGKELAGLDVRQSFAREAKISELAERQRTGEATIRRELEQARQADQIRQATGIRGLFRILTGRAGREAFERVTRDGQRVEAARVKVEALRSELTRERSGFMASQTVERTAMIDRHGREEGQLQEALSARHQIHRAEQVQARQPRQQTIERIQRQDIGRSIGRGLSL